MECLFWTHEFGNPMGITRNVSKRIDQVWLEIDKTYSLVTERVPVLANARAASRRCVQEAKVHLEPWLSVHEQALHVNWHILQFLEGARTKATARTLFPALALASRCCGLSFGIRQLAVSGLEDAARPLARSMVETVEIAIAVLGNEELALAYSDIEGSDEDAFWSKRIGYGRVHSYIESTMRSAGCDENEIRDFRDYRQATKSALSGSVHASISSAFRSYLVPSLLQPNMLAVTPFGHHSLHAPGLLTVPIHLSSSFGGILCKSLMSESPLAIISRGRFRRTRTDKLVAAVFVLDQAIEMFEEELESSRFFQPDVDSDVPLPKS